jgi:cytochrome P450
MTEIAMPVAEHVTCDVFGAQPRPCPGRFADIAYGIALAMDAGLVPSQRDSGKQVSAELDEMIALWFKAPNPTGLSGEIVRDILPLEFPERLIYRTVDAMVNASYSTMYASIGNAALILMQHPTARAAFNAQNVVSGCEELIRFDSPAHATSRVATSRTKISDTLVEEGQTVITLFAAANRDSAKFTSANELVLDRSPNPHLGFGLGPHQCLGADLAYVVLREFVSMLTQHPTLRLAGRPQRFPTATLRWLKSLPVTLAPAVCL